MSGEPIDVEVDSDLEDLIPGFMGRRRDDVLKLRNALADNEMEVLRVTGHSLKGTGGGYGFDGLSEIGARIEAAAKSGDTTVLGEQVAALEDYLARVRVRFR